MLYGSWTSFNKQASLLQMWNDKTTLLVMLNGKFELYMQCQDILNPLYNTRSLFICRYKEGRVILERALIKEVEGIEEGWVKLTLV